MGGIKWDDDPIGRDRLKYYQYSDKRKQTAYATINLDIVQSTNVFDIFYFGESGEVLIS